MQFSASQFVPESGGFMTNEGIQGTQNKASPGVTADTVRAFSISQLAKAQADAQGSGDILQCDGENIKTVNIVGVLMSKAFTSSQVEMQVYDGTGTIRVVDFLSEPEQQTERINTLIEGSYIEVYGSFKGGNLERPDALGDIMAYGYYPIEDHNQIVHHQLSIIFQHLYLTQQQNVPGSANNAAAGMPMGGYQMHTGMPLQQQGAGGQQTSATEMVYDWLKQNGNSNGVHTKQIIASMHNVLPGDLVQQGLNELQNQARAYSTIDDDTIALS